MFNRLFLIFAFFIPCLYAEIIEIDRIEDVRPYAKENSLFLFDIDDTLIDCPFSLGNPAWRKWVKSSLPENAEFSLYDALTLYIAKNAPYKAVEPTTAEVIADLQNQDLVVFAFTARGRSEWNTTTLEGVDRFTHEQLNYAGIDFKKTPVPNELASIDPDYFHEGIIFACHIPKGELLTHLFSDLNFTPSVIIFVDDKLDQVKSVEAAVKEMGIPFIGFWYRHSEIKGAHFDPMVSNIQLEWLFNDVIINDKEARELALELGDDPVLYLGQILEKIDASRLFPSIPAVDYQ